jgi:tetratricopeptide (TPR) repeat protein
MIKRYPNSASVQSLHGLLLLAQGDFSKARSALERAVTIDKNGIEASSGLAALDLAMRDFASAKRRVRALVDASPKRLDVLLLSARVHMAAGDGADGGTGSSPRAGRGPQRVSGVRDVGAAVHLANRNSMPRRAGIRSLGVAPAETGRRGSAWRARFSRRRATSRWLGKRSNRSWAIDQNAPLAANNLAWIYADSR